MDEIQRQLAILTAFGLGGIAVFLWAAVFIAAMCVPFMVWSAARNIKQIRVEFQRLNNLLESQAAVFKP